MMTPTTIFVVVLLSQLCSLTNGYTQQKNHHQPPGTSSRRLFFQRSIPYVVAATAILPDASNALDMDAFMQKELDSDAQNCDEKTDKRCKPKLTDDQALCRFGQPSKETGEACLRAGMPTTRNGSVDAFGKSDRGDYVRCKIFYQDDGKKLVKTRTCE